MTIKPIVIQFNSKRTPNDLYKLTLKTLEEMALTIGTLDDKKLEDLRKEVLFLLWSIEAKQSQNYLDGGK